MSDLASLPVGERVRVLGGKNFEKFHGGMEGTIVENNPESRNMKVHFDDEATSGSEPVLVAYAHLEHAPDKGGYRHLKKETSKEDNGKAKETGFLKAACCCCSWPTSSNEDTPPPNTFNTLVGVEIGEQEATPTFDVSKTLVAVQQPAMKFPSEAKVLSQMAGELCSAACEGDMDTLKKLIASGHVVNACDYDRRTAIHIAAAEGNKEVVSYLLSQRADSNAKDRWGHTAFDEAKRASHKEVLDLLAKERPAMTDSSKFTRQTSDMEAAAILCSAAATANTAQIQKLLETLRWCGYY
eukprot:symbB.v1.2.007048.t1/scaffold414.1/size398445/12